MKRVTTQVDAETWKLVKIECAKRGININEAIAEALRQWLPKEAKK